jgi:mono/diheme cytochrome c family protein
MIRLSALALVEFGMIFALLALPSAAGAQSPAEQRGMTFVHTNCARCHSIDKISPSPLQPAPPFRDLHLRYPIESLAEAFAEGIRTGHPSMPEFRLDSGQIRDVLAYLKSLER